MADDFEEHKIVIKTDKTMKLCDFLSYILKKNFLASISGGKATWVLKYQNIYIVVVAQEWNEPKYLINKNKTIDEIINESEKEFHFKYLAQISPDKTYQKLKEAMDDNIQITELLSEYIKNEY